METEDGGMYEALKWLCSCGWQRVVIETDAQLVVQFLNFEENYQVEVGHIIDECKELMANRSKFSINHVKNQANKVLIGWLESHAC